MTKYEFSAIWTTHSTQIYEVEAETEEEAREKLEGGDYDVVDDNFDTSKMEDITLDKVDSKEVRK